MKQVNDVEILFDSINADPDSYQEIVHHQDVIKSLERWPLIAAINHVKPIETPPRNIAEPVSSSAEVSTSTPSLIVSEAITVEQTLILKPTSELLEGGNGITAIDGLTENDRLTIHVSNSEAPEAQPAEAGSQVREFTATPRRGNRASSENISSIFKRLEYS